MKKYYDILDTGGGGGGNKLPEIPKNYAPLTVADRAAWNGFLDYAGKQNLNLADPKVQATALAQYKKANPAFSITPDKVPSIQYEAYQLRKGDSFGNLNAKQLEYIRQGMNPNFLNADVSNVGKTYYPQLGTYGTDVEGYYNSKFNPGAVAPQAQPAAPKPKAAPVAFTNPLPTTVANKTIAASDIPATYAAHDSALKRTQQLAAMPGNEFLHNRGDALINANYVPNWTDDTKSLRDSAIGAAKSVGLDPAILWASSAEEGATGLIPKKDGSITTDPDIDLDGKYRVSGFTNFGLDNFHSNFKELVKRGYLPKDFDYKPSTHVNELGSTVHSGDFKTVEDAMKAKAAYMRMEQDNIDAYAKKNNIQLSDKARQFFTLVNFNGGSGDETHKGAGAKMMDYYAKKGLLKDDKFIDVAPEPGLGLGQYYEHIHPRFQVAALLKKEGIFQ